MVKNPLDNAVDMGLILAGEDPLEKEVEAHPSILAWRIPWTEEPGGLPSTGSQTVGRDFRTKEQQDENSDSGWLILAAC